MSEELILDRLYLELLQDIALLDISLAGFDHLVRCILKIYFKERQKDESRT